MNLSELVAHVGHKNIKVQRVDTSLVRSSTNKKGITRITFETDQIDTHEFFNGVTPRMHGLIIWMPTELLREVFPNKKIP